MRVYCLVMLIVGLALSLAPAATAYENHEMWEKIRTRGKLCMKYHEHHGASPAWATKKGARAYARRNWESFTKWEYGKAWGRLRLAIGKRERCVRSGSRWVCSVIARPCRRLRR